MRLLIRNAGRSGGGKAASRNAAAHVGHGRGIALDDIGESDGHALRRLVVGISAAVVRPRYGERPCGDIRSGGARIHGSTVCTQGVVRVGEGEVHRLSGANVLASTHGIVTEGAGQAKLITAHQIRTRRKNNVSRAVVLFICRRNGGNALGLHRQGGGGITREHVIIVIHTKHGHGISARIGCGIGCFSACLIGKGQIGTRHTGMGGGDSHKITRDHVGCTQGDGTCAAVINHRARRGKSDGDLSCLNGPACANGFHFVVRVSGVAFDDRQVLSSHVHAVLAHIHGSIGCACGSGSDGSAARSRHESDGNGYAVAPVDTGRREGHTVCDAVIGHAAHVGSVDAEHIGCRSGVVRRERKSDGSALNSPIERCTGRDGVVICRRAGQGDRSGIVARGGSRVRGSTVREIHLGSSRIGGINLTGRFGSHNARSVKACGHASLGLVVNEGRSVIPSDHNALGGDAPITGEAAVRQIVVHVRCGGDVNRGGVITHVHGVAIRQGSAVARGEGVLREYGITRDHTGEGYRSAVLRVRVVSAVAARPSNTQSDLLDGKALVCRRKGVSIAVCIIRGGCTRKDVCGIVARVHCHVIGDHGSIVAAVHGHHGIPTRHGVCADHITVGSRHFAFAGVCRAVHRCAESPIRPVVSDGERRGLGDDGGAVRHGPYVLRQGLLGDRNGLLGGNAAQVVVIDRAVVGAISEAAEREGGIHRQVACHHELMQGVIRIVVRGAARQIRRQISGLGGGKVIKVDLDKVATADGVLQGLAADEAVKVNDITLVHVRTGVHVGSGSRIRSGAVIIRPAERRDRFVCGSKEVRLSVS